MADHYHKVSDSHTRSLLVSGTANLIEFIVDFIIVNVLLGRPVEALGIAAGMQVICYLCTYASLRIWCKIKWGRKIEDVKC